ncbi:hypothetical protein MRB53_006561 [Persea americana]|uniref:Uncharacterized protein n=1 Tax=Persea americana TaxID=3435 RepID=A0ACC2MGR3_PERAE|nr:hypothetical protein MRB53_006561 [Persea americana]
MLPVEFCWQGCGDAVNESGWLQATFASVEATVTGGERLALVNDRATASIRSFLIEFGFALCSRDSGWKAPEAAETRSGASRTRLQIRTRRER